MYEEVESMDFIWIIIGAVIACLAAILLGVQIVADCGSIISIAFAVLCFLMCFSSAQKNEKLWAISEFAIFSSSIASVASYLSSVKNILDGAGGFLDLIFCIIGGAFGNIILFGFCFFLIDSQEYMKTNERNEQVVWNFLVRTPIAYIIFFILKKFFGY